MEKKELKRYILLAVIVVVVCLIVKNLSVLAVIIRMIFAAFYPLLLGCAIAYVFNIFLSFCERYYFPKTHKGIIAYTRRPVCLFLAIAITLGIIAGILYIVVPEVVTAAKLLSSEIPPAAVKVKAFAVKYLHDYPEIQQKLTSAVDIDLSDIAKTATGKITSGAVGILASVAEWIGELTLTVTRLLIAIIFAIYILLRKNRLRRDVKRLKAAFLSERVNVMLSSIFHTANATFRSFFVGQFVEAIILGSLCALGMCILKLPYAAMTGTVIGVTALVPIVGAYIGAAVGAFMICTISPFQALEFMIFLVILQQFEGNIIYPKVVGTSIGLPGIWVLAAVTVGGSLFGVAGMLLGVPLAATIYKLYFMYLAEREAKLGIVPEPCEFEKQSEQTKPAVSHAASKSKQLPKNKRSVSGKNKRKK